MYIAAAACLWFLKAWKVGQLESIAEAEKRAPGAVDPVEACDAPAEEQHGRARTPFLKRMLIWRKV